MIDLLGWTFVALLVIVAVSKAIGGYHAASAASRLGHSAAQRAIAYGIMLPVVSYALFVYAVLPGTEIDDGSQTAAALCGLVILAVFSPGLAWGWRRHDKSLAALFDRAGRRI